MRWKNGIILGIFLILILTPFSFAIADPLGVKVVDGINAKKYQIEWDHMFGGAGSDGTRSLIQTADGGYVIAGWTASYSFGDDWDMWLVKTDSNGNPEWNRTFGGVLNEDAFSLIQTIDGGYALAGWTSSYSYSVGKGDFWLVKTDAIGQLEWNRTFGGPEKDEVRSIIQTKDGGYALVGYTFSFGAGDCDIWLVKTNASGHEEWNQTFGGIGNDQGNSLVQTSTGDYILAVDSDLYGSFGLVKINTNSQVVWNQSFGGTGWQWASSLVHTNDGGYALAGGYTTGEDNADILLVKTDASGLKEWMQVLEEGNAGLMGCPVIQTTDGGFAVAGNAHSSPDKVGFYFAKINASGHVEGHQILGEENGAEAHSLLQTADGGYLVAGYAYHSDNFDTDMWLMKIIESEFTGSTPSWAPTIALISMVTLVILYKRKHY